MIITPLGFPLNRRVERLVQSCLRIMAVIVHASWSFCYRGWPCLTFPRPEPKQIAAPPHLPSSSSLSSSVDKSSDYRLWKGMGKFKTETSFRVYIPISLGAFSFMSDFIENEGGDQEAKRNHGRGIGRKLGGKWKLAGLRWGELQLFTPTTVVVCLLAQSLGYRNIYT